MKQIFQSILYTFLLSSTVSMFGALPVTAPLSFNVLSNPYVFAKTLVPRKLDLTYQATAACFSPDSKKVVTTGFVDGRPKISIWQTDNRKLLNEWIVDDRFRVISACQFFADNKHFVTAANHGIITIWRTDGVLLYTFETFEDLRSIHLNADCSKLLTSHEQRGKACLWDIHGNFIRDFPTFRHAKFSPDGTCVVTGKDFDVTIWRIIDGARLKTFNGPLYSYIESVEFSADGSQIISGSSDSRIRLWNIADGSFKELNGSFKELKGYEQESVVTTSFNPLNTMILSASWYGGRIRLWNKVNGELLNDFDVHGQNTWVFLAQFSPDSSKIVSRGYDGNVYIWESSIKNKTLSLKQALFLHLLDKHHSNNKKIELAVLARENNIGIQVLRDILNSFSADIKTILIDSYAISDEESQWRLFSSRNIMCGLAIAGAAILGAWWYLRK